MTTQRPKETKEPLEKLRHALNLLESEDDIRRDFIVGVEAPASGSILSDQNLSAYEYYEIPFNNEIYQSMQESAATQVRNRFDEIEETSSNLEAYSISNTERDNVPLQYVEWDELERPERYNRIINTDSFDFTSFEEQSDIGFQAFRISSERTGERVVAFQKFTRRQVSGDTDGHRLTMNGDEYDSFEQEVITIPSQIDCLWFRDTIFVFQAKRFEDIFDYLQQHKRHANTVLTGIDDSELNIHNMDEFVDSIENDRRALRKMESVQKRGLYENMEREDVEDVVDEFDLGVNVETNDDDEWGITIPDLRQKWDVIRLLNDDHVISYVTDLQYQVYGKDLRN